MAYYYDEFDFVVVAAEKARRRFERNKAAVEVTIGITDDEGWEARMAARARARRERREAAIAVLRKRYPDPPPTGPYVKHYVGTCDVCGEVIASVFDWSTGCLDYGMDSIGVYTWIRHSEGPAPDCDRIFSRVYETPEPLTAR